MRARNETLVLGLFKFKHNETEILRHCVVVPLTYTVSPGRPNYKRDDTETGDYLPLRRS